MAHYRIHVLAGQSNAEGVGTVSELSTALSAALGVHYYKPSESINGDGSIVHLRAGINNQFNNTILSRFGPEIGISYQLTKEELVDDILVKYTLSGSPMDGDISATRAWRKSDNELYPRLIYGFLRPLSEFLAECGHTCEMYSFSWIHGEADTTNETAAINYYQNMVQFLNDIKGDCATFGMSTANTKWIIALLPKIFVNGVRPFYDAVDQGMLDLKFGSALRNRPAYPNVYLIRRHDNTFNADNIHENTFGQLQMGRRIASVILGGEDQSSDVADVPLQHWRVAVNELGYNAFGKWCFGAGMPKALYAYRNGTSHANNVSNIKCVSYDFATERFSQPFTIVAEPTLDVREGMLDIINDKLFLFYDRRNSAASPVVTQQMGYISTSDLTGQSGWSSYTTLPFECSNAAFYGKLLAGTVPGTYYKTFWDANLQTNDKYIVGYFKTTDYGQSWSKVKAYEGTLRLNESSMEILPGGRLIIISRIELFASSGLYQITSTDEGQTWSAPVKINIAGATERNVPELMYEASTNRLILLYQNRSNSYLEYSIANADTVFSSPTSWPAPVLWYRNNPTNSTSFPGLGYPSILKHPSKPGYLVAWAQEWLVDPSSRILMKEWVF
jgi:hypothetical protein